MTNRQNKCFISLAIKALGIKKKFELYTSEKEIAKAGKFSDTNNQNSLATKFSESFNTLHQAPRRKNAGLINKFRVEDSVENFILKSVLGFLGGIFLTYICFMFLVFSLNFTLKRATYICMGLGVILSLGLAFSVKIRCTVFLCIPQLFSKRGRQALLAYAFILALSGPAKNTLHNVEVMSESLACTQEQLKQAENELLKCVQKPNAAAKKSIEKLLERINSAVKDFKNFILQLYKNCFTILETVLHSQKWLYSITILCHKKLGHPAHACLNLLAEASANCESILPLNSWKNLCEISPRCQRMICFTKQKTVCLNSDVKETLPVLKLQKQLDTFKRRAMNMLYVKIEAQQTYSQANRSHTYHEEYQGMATEIRQKTDQFLQYFDFMSVIFGIFILVLFVKVVIYRHKFLTEDHYDNRYITSDFVDIDNTRAAFHMETILPLEPREKMQYIKVTSVRLVPCEKVRLLSSFVFLIFATFKIIIHMLTDSSLYWILSSVRRDERLLYMSTITEEQPAVTVRVQGYGLVASLFQNVTRVVKKESSFVRMDPTPCLPDPVPPDWNRYYQILALVIICWLLALWEPYGLRLRHTVMVTYHPDRARERAIWLYNRIISNRINFVKTSRRRLRRKYRSVSLQDTFRFKFFGKNKLKCLLCEVPADRVNCIQCPTPNCPGLYCEPCFTILKLCSICRDPSEYDDPSDISQEKDSSEEDSPRKTHPKKTRKRKPGELRKKGTTKENENKRETETKGTKPLLNRTLSYYRKKFTKYKHPNPSPDCESSDWDHSSLLLTEGRSSDEKEHSSEDGKRSAKSETADVKVRMSEFIPERIVPEQQISAEEPIKDDVTPRSLPVSKPDFLFKSLGNSAEESKSSPLAKFLFKQKSPPTEKSNKRDVGVLARVQAKMVDLRNVIHKKDFDSPRTNKSDSDANSSPRKMSRLPFIDPVNVHEFGTDSEFCNCKETKTVKKEEKQERREKKTKEKKKLEKLLAFMKASEAVGQLPRLSKTHSTTGSVTLYYQPECETSANDGQYYSDSYLSPGSVNLGSNVKRAQGNLNFKIPPESKPSTLESSPERDSPNEKFVKVPTKRTSHRKSNRIKRGVNSCEKIQEGELTGSSKETTTCSSSGGEFYEGIKLSRKVSKASKDSENSKQSRDSKDSRELEVLKDFKNVKDLKELKDFKDLELKDFKNVKELEEVKNFKDSKDSKDSRDSKGSKDSKDSKDLHS